VELPDDERLEAMAPAELLQLGIDLHNSGRFFEAHEAWEAVWLRSPEPLRRFYQGLIQITAGFVHLTRNEYPGTHRLLGEGLTKLRSFEPDFLGVYTARLAGEAGRMREEVLSRGERGLAEIDRTTIPHVEQLQSGEIRELGVPGRVLAYREWAGAGAGTVVLIHGAGQAGRLWLPVAARLSEGARVLAPDLPGHGRSDPRPGGVEPVVRALAAWVAAVAPDTRSVVGLGTAGARIAEAVAAEADATVITCDPESDAEAEALAARSWPGAWEIFDELRRRSPYKAWRADLLWWLAEGATEKLADGSIRLQPRLDDVAALTDPSEGHASMSQQVESPLVDPVASAERIRRVLESA